MPKRGEVFDPVTLEWGGETYTIPPNRMFGAIKRIEDVITIPELHATAAKRGTVKMATLSEAFAAVLNYAGADVTAEEVYAGMFDGNTSADAASAAMLTLMGIMVPPQAIQQGGAAVTGKKEEGAPAA